MLALVALIAALQTTSTGDSPAAREVARPETLAQQLSARGVRLLVAASDQDDPDRASRTAGRCFSQGESAAGGERLCIYDCSGMVAAVSVSPERSCPVSLRAPR